MCPPPQVRLSVVRIFRRVSERVRRLSSVGAAPLAEGDLEDPCAKPSQTGRGSDAGSNDSDKRKVRLAPSGRFCASTCRGLLLPGWRGTLPWQGGPG